MKRIMSEPLSETGCQNDQIKLNGKRGSGLHKVDGRERSPSKTKHHYVAKFLMLGAR